MSKYVINVSFNTRVNKTIRTLEIAESFGLGLDEKAWTLYDNLELDIERGDVVYVTGQSGSGKSVVLRELQRLMADAGQRVASIDDFVFADDTNVIDQLGKTTSDALGLLSMAGLNDAYLFVRKPSEMSDGQKYRLKIAKLIESGADVWVADEFGAVLDRVTAQVVASNLQRAARAVGATVIVATTHEDLKNALRPSV
ncbi:TPA: ATP-binding cassette domain-containing protein, partial [Klebsiella quasipneumoniae subsp. quasipneumoniae]